MISRERRQWGFLFRPKAKAELGNTNLFMAVAVNVLQHYPTGLTVGRKQSKI